MYTIYIYCIYIYILYIYIYGGQELHFGERKCSSTQVKVQRMSDRGRLPIEDIVTTDTCKQLTQTIPVNNSHTCRQLTQKSAASILHKSYL